MNPPLPQSNPDSIATAIVRHARELYAGESPIPLHRPVFLGEEKALLAECVDTNFVSSVGRRVDEFERLLAEFTSAKYAVAVVNGTAALQVALRLVGVQPGDEVITQALSFVATANAIAHCGARPVFVDVDRTSLGMSPAALEAFLETGAERRAEGCFNRLTGKRISACLPMHTFGHPCQIESIARICADWGIELVEDAAESLGSYRNGRHSGTFGRLGVFSFNGNKIITTGGGGVIVSDDPELAVRAKHLTTTAKQPHAYEYVHDELGFNFRMPNLNAALGCAQMAQLDGFLAAKRNIARSWQQLFEALGIICIVEPPECRSNYWLNAIVLDSPQARDHASSPVV